MHIREDLLFDETERISTPVDNRRNSQKSHCIHTQNVDVLKIGTNLGDLAFDFDFLIINGKFWHNINVTQML